jgi:ribose transport system permease protein
MKKTMHVLTRENPYTASQKTNKFKFQLGPAIPYIVLLILAVILVFLQPKLLSFNWLSIKSNAAFTLVLVAIGQMIVILTGGMDLSIGGIVSLASAITATSMSGSGSSIVFWSLVVLVIGILIGAINGMIIVYLKIQPFIATLATWSIVGGAALVILPTDGGTVPEQLNHALTGSLGTVPNTLLYIVILLVMWGYFKKTKMGKQIYSVGSNEHAAYLNGTNVKIVKIFVYSLSGLFGALGGLYLSAYTGTGSPTIGNNYILMSVTAVILGGVNLSGGRGSMLGSVVGVFILLFINDLLLFSGVSTYYTSLFQGFLLIATVTVSSITVIMNRRRKQL